MLLPLWLNLDAPVTGDNPVEWRVRIGQNFSWEARVTLSTQHPSYITQSLSWKSRI